MNNISRDELREKLAAIEHERWSDWQKYQHSKLKAIKTVIHGKPVEGMLMLPEDYQHWEEQIATEYSELSEREKASDMEQVDRYWSLIENFVEQQVREAIEGVAIKFLDKGFNTAYHDRVMLEINQKAPLLYAEICNLVGRYQQLQSQHNTKEG